MISGLYCLRDAATCSYGMVSQFANDRAATRAYALNVKRGNGQLDLMIANPGDFSLYCLGGFDDDTGEVKAELRLICNFSDILAEAKQNEQSL